LFVCGDIYCQFNNQQQQLIDKLQESKEIEKSLKEKILKEQQKFSDLLGKYDDLQLSPLLSKEIQAELTQLQATMKDVSISIEKVEMIQQYWNAKVFILCIQFSTLQTANFL